MLISLASARLVITSCFPFFVLVVLFKATCFGLFLLLTRLKNLMESQETNRKHFPLDLHNADARRLKSRVPLPDLSQSKVEPQGFLEKGRNDVLRKLHLRQMYL